MLKKLKAMAVVVLVGAAAGCQIISAVTYKVAGEAKNPAEFKPANVPTLVLVENYTNPDQYRVASTLLERDIAGQLRENKVVTQVISVEKLEDLRSADAAGYRKMQIKEVGKAVGAKQVLYVNLTKFSTEAPIGSTEMAGRSEALVRIIDVETGRSLWPQDNSAGREVKYDTKHEEAVDFSNHDLVEQQISQSLADRIARLFYASADAENDVSPK